MTAAGVEGAARSASWCLWAHAIVSYRRCCVNRNWPRALPRVGSSPIDRARLWSTKLGHSIEHVARTHRFDSLRCASPTSKSIAEHRRVPEERVLDAGLSMIADLLLPSTAPNLADPSDRPIASARPRVASGQLGCLVEGERVVGRVRRDRPRAAGNGRAVKSVPRCSRHPPVSIRSMPVLASSPAESVNA